MSKLKKYLFEPIPTNRLEVIMDLAVTFALIGRIVSLKKKILDLTKEEREAKKLDRKYAQVTIDTMMED